MELVVDANILFAALIKNSHTRHLLLSGKHTLYFPEFLLEELNEKAIELENKTGLTHEQLKELLNQFVLFASIQIIAMSEFSDFLGKAEKISPDPDDVPYFALALKLNCGIWSNDKKLKEQQTVRIHSTEEV